MLIETHNQNRWEGGSIWIHYRIKLFDLHVDTASNSLKKISEYRNLIGESYA